jgi:hypothetical protein
MYNVRKVVMTGSTAFGLKLRIAAAWRDRDVDRAASIDAPRPPLQTPEARRKGALPFPAAQDLAVGT